MATINISRVYLLDIPLENDYKNTLYFSDKTAQYDYFISKRVHDYLNVSYQRKDFKIRVPEHIDSLYNCNYVMYQNTHYTNKWVYAFITDMEYINEEVTEITIETDVMQTWMFDYEVKPSFIEREHVTNDTAGSHTLPEGLETGEYICNSKVVDEKLLNLDICMAYSDYANSNLDVKGNIYGGIYSGLKYSAYPRTTSGIEHLNEDITEYDEDAKADAINSLFMAPWFLTGGSSDAGPRSVGISTTPRSYDFSVAKLSSLNGYTPRNKKLLTYPYVFIRGSNNAGNTAIYKQELFSTSSCGFSVKGVLTPGCSIRTTPKNYNGVELNNDCGLNAGKFPICCWNSDTYTNWLTQNSLNIQTSGISAAGMISGGVIASLTGVGALAGVPMILSGLSQIKNTMNQMYQASLEPDQVKGNTNTGDVITSSNENTFMYYRMSIKKEFAECIDKYFDMYGYQVNIVKTPNKNHRARWWFTKTIDANIDGAIPNKDLQKIKDCYNKGITFWKNPSEIQNYNLTNEIV